MLAPPAGQRKGGFTDPPTALIILPVSNVAPAPGSAAKARAPLLPVVFVSVRCCVCVDKPFTRWGYSGWGVGGNLLVSGCDG